MQDASDHVPPDRQDPWSYKDPWEYYWSQHDWLSHRFTWHEQHLLERFLDLEGFMASISGSLEEEALDYSKATYPTGFYEVEQPTRIRYVYLIFLFTIFERRVRAICRVVDESDPNTGLTLDVLNGTLSQRLKAFFAARLELDVTSLPEWEPLQTLQKVRDCIVHCGGCIRESRDRDVLRTLSHGDSGLRLSAWDYLLIEELFCEQMSGTVLKFFDTVMPRAHRIIRERILESRSRSDGKGLPEAR